MDIPPKDFKWFGEGFDGFPKILPENCMEYRLYIVHSPSHESTSPSPSLDDVLAEALNLKDKYLKDYIWQQDGFHLEAKTADEQLGTQLLYGHTDYSDSVEDEWLIVFLLRELSQKFEELWISVVDSDGEFLLIEAASALPRWLNPEVASNRVWIHSGNLLIIPISQSEGKGTKKGLSSTRSLTLTSALGVIKDSPEDFVHSSKIQKEAFYRLRNYPNQIPQNLHSSVILIPRNLVYILRKRPEFISPATTAFLLQDPIAIAALSKGKKRDKDNPGVLLFPWTDLVNFSVKFTKVTFAQLKSESINLRPELLEQIEKSDNPKLFLSRIELGQKVVLAFEILVQDPRNREKPVVKDIKMLLDNIKQNVERLPSNEDMKTWKVTDDSEDWLDVNFEDFERELSGKGKEEAKRGANDPSGFGSQTAEENLRKMVARFEQFLNDDTAGLDGAELSDEMDMDDDDDETEDGEDKAGSFDETEFEQMMRQMMGLPLDDAGTKRPANNRSKSTSRIEEVNTDDEEIEEEEVRDIMQQMETELKAAGALNLEPGGSKKPPNQTDTGSFGEDDDNYNKLTLAKNMLESLKSQNGMAGPGGNLMGLMGMQMPLDADDVQHSGSRAKKEKK